MTSLFHSSHIFVCVFLALAAALVFLNRGQS